MRGLTRPAVDAARPTVPQAAFTDGCVTLAQCARARVDVLSCKSSGHWPST